MSDRPLRPLSFSTAERRKRIRKIWQEIIEVVQVRYNLTEAEAEQEVSGWMKKLGMRVGKK
jgi:aryl-alcohol dehydrogenase-like predicted oxidoreductase